MVVDANGGGGDDVGAIAGAGWCCLMMLGARAGSGARDGGAVAGAGGGASVHGLILAHSFIVNILGMT